MNIKKLTFRKPSTRKVVSATGLAFGIGATAAAVVATRNTLPAKVAAPVLTRLAVQAGVMHTAQALFAGGCSYVANTWARQVTGGTVVYSEAVKTALKSAGGSLLDPSSILLSLAWGLRTVNGLASGLVGLASSTVAIGNIWYTAKAMKAWDEDVAPFMTVVKDEEDQGYMVPSNLFILEDDEFEEAAKQFADSLKVSDTPQRVHFVVHYALAGMDYYNDGEVELFIDIVNKRLQQRRRRSA